MGQAQGGHSRCCRELLLHVPCPAYKAAQSAQGTSQPGSSGLCGSSRQYHALDALRHTAADLLQHRRQQAATDALRDGVLLHEYWEQSTYYFHHLHRQRKQAIVITRLQQQQGSPVFFFFFCCWKGWVFITQVQRQQPQEYVKSTTSHRGHS